MELKRRSANIGAAVISAVLLSPALGSLDTLAQAQSTSLDRVATSLWSAAAPAVDGLGAEWKGDYMYYERTADLDFAFRNDGRDLYVLLVFRNPKVLEPLEATGLAVFAGPASAGKAPTGVRFVEKMVKADAFIKMVESRGTRLTESEKKDLRAEKRHAVFLAAAVDRKGRTLNPPDPASGVLPPAFARTKDGAVTTYEFRIPLAPRDVTSAGIGAAPGDALLVDFEWGGVGDKIFTAKSTWQSALPSSGDSSMLGSGETRAQDFLSTFDRMSRPTSGGKKYAFSVAVKLAAPQPPAPSPGR